MTGNGRFASDIPAVSVIVLGYNGEEYVDGCLTSVLDQDFERPYEVLFVDNASRDKTAARAETYAGVRVQRLGTNHGYCGGNNIGAELAKGELLVFLNQDVVVHRSWLRELVGAVESDPSIKAAHANVIHPWNAEFDKKERTGPIGAAYAGELSRLGYVEYREFPPDQQAVDTLFLSGVSIILKREAIEELGGYVFDPGMFLYGEDVDLGLRIRTAGYRAVVAPRAVVYHAHVLQDRLSVRSFFKTVRIIRNRLLAVWKNSDWPEFIPLGAITLFGAPFNSSQFGLPLKKKLAYFFLLIPPTLLAGLWACVLMPRFAVRRNDILARRRVGRWWLLRTLVFDRRSLRKKPAPAVSRT
jgi:GT2 family glycosyltransferase